MLYNIYYVIFHISGAKVRLFFDMRKYFQLFFEKNNQSLHNWKFFRNFAPNLQKGVFYEETTDHRRRARNT